MGLFKYSIRAILTGMMLLISNLILGQGFLHADGKRIVNGAGENVILRGIGTGNWMLQEGYMMQSSGAAGTQHEFREKLIQTIGETKTDSFYTVWLDNHFTRTDADSMASWGFNSVRVAMHYKWFTLPIEEEPISGEQTWLDKGFTMIDSLLRWCGDNEMYLILDMHGAPGGQGANADISDYDPSKPSLWESQDNKDKTVALWQKLAARYSEEQWIGGYDLINETNWTFPEGNNSQMKTLFTRITDSIRSVDENHLIIIEGNSWANDYSGLTPPWDSNMAYSFHKYWTYNNSGSLGWVTGMRDQYNVPIWLGESGENSNTWFTNLIALCESQNIGWSWWPVKKAGINNVLKVDVNDDYTQLIENWKGNGPYLSDEEAFQAVLKFADNHRIENCHYQKDVVDAMIRQVHSEETLPFIARGVLDTIFTSDYDLGRSGYAYGDNDTANYHGDTDEYTSWNQGWAYRNDGVDIEACTDSPVSNGYNVGWTGDGEWMAYTLESDSLASYSLEIRSASGGSGSRVHVEVNGVDATGPVQLPATGGWQSWRTTELDKLILPEGEVQLRLVFEEGGSNLNYFRLKNPQSVSELSFEYLSASTAILENIVYISLNKELSSPEAILVSDFSLSQAGKELAIDSIIVSEEDGRMLLMYTSESLFYGKTIEISYTGTSLMHNEQALAEFVSEKVENQMARHYSIPSRVQAENFYVNNGLVLESCSDVGGGSNTGYAHPGDYLDYILFAETEGDYEMSFRIATEQSGARLRIQADYGEGFQTLQTVTFDKTGGWQTWTTQSTTVHLEAGKYILRLLVSGSEHNLNWFQFKEIVSSVELPEVAAFTLYPNPASDQLTLKLGIAPSIPMGVELMDSMGRLVYENSISSDQLVVDISGWTDGIYFVRLGEKGMGQVRKLLVNSR